MAQPSRQSLNEVEFLQRVVQRMERGHGVAESVSWVLSRHELLPDLAHDYFMRGATDAASDAVARLPRDRILRLAFIHRAERNHDILKVADVVRSPLRDWPISIAAGIRLELCTVEQVEGEVMHLDKTIGGLYRRRRPLAAATKAARDRGLTVMGDLPDEVLDACLEGSNGNGTSQTSTT